MSHRFGVSHQEALGDVAVRGSVGMERAAKKKPQPFSTGLISIRSPVGVFHGAAKCAPAPGRRPCGHITRIWLPPPPPLRPHLRTPPPPSPQPREVARLRLRWATARGRSGRPGASGPRAPAPGLSARGHWARGGARAGSRRGPRAAADAAAAGALGECPHPFPAPGASIGS